MIAANFRKHPEAMALQLVLQFGRALIWALPRPTTRILRAVRSARAKAFQVAGRIAYPVRRNTPAWVRASAKRSRLLGQMVRKAQRALNFEAPRKLNPFAQRLADMREQFDRYVFGVSA